MTFRHFVLQYTICKFDLLRVSCPCRFYSCRSSRQHTHPGRSTRQQPCQEGAHNPGRIHLFLPSRRLRQMRKFLSREHRQRLVSAVILSRIDYCNAILVRLPDVSLLPLRRVLNAAARFINELGPRDHVSQMLRELHWLPIRECIEFKLGTMMKVIVHGTAPKYMCNKITPVTDLPGHSHLRSAAHGLFHVPHIRTRLSCWSI